MFSGETKSSATLMQLCRLRTWWTDQHINVTHTAIATKTTIATKTAM